MNGYELLPIFESIPPPQDVNSSKEWFRYYLTELVKRRPDLTITSRSDSFERYKHLAHDVPRAVECELFPAPSDEELGIEKEKVLAQGIYGRTYLVKMRRECLLTVDPRQELDDASGEDITLPAIVKDMLPAENPARVYENMLHEVLMNQLVLRDTIVRQQSFQFPLQYAFIVCSPAQTYDSKEGQKEKENDLLSTGFCDAPLQGYASQEDINRDLLQGRLRMFSVQEKVNGCTWGEAIDTGVYSHSDPREMLSILFQLFGALDQVNAKRVYVHNDLHLNNVMLVTPNEITPTLLFKSSDGVMRELNNPKHIAVIIDEGRASGSYVWKGRTYLAVLDSKYGAFMGTDILRMFYNMLAESPRDSPNYAITKRMLGRLFGPDVFVFLKRRETPESYSEFMMFLHSEFANDRELWKALISVSYLQALRVVEEEWEKTQSP